MSLAWLADRAQDQGVDQANDRSALAQFLELGEADFRLFVFVLGDLQFVGIDALDGRADQLAHVVVHAERAKNSLANILLGGDDRVYLQPGTRLQRVYRRDVERVHHRYRHGGIAAFDGNHAHFHRQAVRDQTGYSGVNINFCQIDKRDADLLAHAARFLLFGDMPQTRQQVADRFGRVLALAQNAVEFLGRDQAVVNENVGKSSVVVRGIHSCSLFVIPGVVPHVSSYLFSLT